MKSTPRFYIPDVVFKSGQRISLPNEAVHHAMRVLRLKEGEEVEGYDGIGNSAAGKIHFERDRAEILVETVTTEQGIRLRIVLLQALVSNEKMDWIVEKACELGTSAVFVFPPERTDIKASGDKLIKKLERWRRISIAACSQCGRNQLLQVEFCPSLQSAMEKSQGLKILLHPATEDISKPLPKKLDAVTFLIGPEGGFSQKEIASALALGFEAKKLGNLVLRTETAGIVAAAFAQTLWGCYRPTESTPSME